MSTTANMYRLGWDERNGGNISYMLETKQVAEYLDLNNVVSYEIRYADGRYGAADVALIRVKEGKAEEVMNSLENRKDDRINEFRNYDVYEGSLQGNL